jgi:copper chaperone CopZ
MAKKITLKISGMECPNCSMILERIEDKLAGVVMAEASYRKEQLVVEYNEAQLSEEQIKAEVERMGYQVVAVSQAGK